MTEFIDLPKLGTLKTRTTDEIQDSNWCVGCETLDRDYADYDQYKGYLKPLGIKRLRLQGGWAKTEKTPGVYDWQWLDHIVDDAVSQGLQPWIQTGYGNAIYPGAGGENLGAGMPLSKVGMAAYEKWVAAMVTRYQAKVFDWEVWNEPNFADNAVNTPEIAGDFNIRTAELIKKIQPQARISALALGHINLDYVARFFKYLGDRDAFGLFHDVTYHDYVYNPDANQLKVYRMRQLLNQYAPAMIMRQGENGAPSVANAGGALGEYAWSELSQAKWDSRRMLENLGHDIESSVFSISDMHYHGNGPINKLNSKGLLQTDDHHRVLRPKLAYRAVQNVATLFDDQLKRLPDVNFTHNPKAMAGNDYNFNSDRSIAVYGYQEKSGNQRFYTIWNDEAIPQNTNEIRKLDFTFFNCQFTEPVAVDVISGAVYQIPAANCQHADGADQLRAIPVYDGPIVITDRSAITLTNQ